MKMRKINILTILFLNSAVLASSQELIVSSSSVPVNSINLNLLGQASSVVISYERIIPLSSFLLITADLGAGYGKVIELGPDTTDVNKPPIYMTTPHHVSINIGRGRNFLEAGMGGTAVIGNAYPHYIFFPIIGYRFQPLTSGNMKVRLYGNFLLGSSDEFRNIFFTPFGLSLGFCF